MILKTLWTVLFSLLVFAAFLYRRRKPAVMPEPLSDPLDRLLRAAFDHSPVGVGYIDANGAWIYVNRRLALILGYTPSEMQHVPLRMLTHAEDRRREGALLASLRSGRSSGYTLVKRLHRKTGEFRTCRVQMLRCGEESNAIYQCTIEDVGLQTTSIEHVVAALQDVEDAAIIHCDASGTISRWSRGAERLFGYSESEMVGRPWHELHGVDHHAVPGMLAEATRAGRLVEPGTRTRADGSTVAVVSTIVPYVQMQSTGFVEVCRAAGPSPLAFAAIENERLRGVIEEFERKEISFGQTVTMLRASNVDLSRKVRLLATGIRKLMTERDSTRQMESARGSLAAVAPAHTSARAEVLHLSGENLDDVLRRIVAEARTGSLEIHSDAGQERLIFESGRLVACTGDREENFVGNLLVEAGVITETQRITVLDSQKETGEAFGSSVVRLGMATASDLANVIRVKAHRELAESVTWTGLRLTFTSGAASQRALAPVDIDVLAILSELTEAAESNGHCCEGAAAAAHGEFGKRIEAADRFIARANSKSNVYHTADCQSAQNIPRSARLTFNSSEHARSEQYVPCKKCVGRELSH